MSKTTNKFSPEVRERAVRWSSTIRAAWIAMAGGDVDLGEDRLRAADSERLGQEGRESIAASVQASRARWPSGMKALERENRELRQANEILRKASAIFCDGGVRPPVEVMVNFIDDLAVRMGSNRSARCCRSPLPPTMNNRAKRADPARLSDRAKRDEALRPEIQRVIDANWQVYGVRKIWRQLRREGFDVARCTVARLMKSMSIQGIIRGKPQKTTIPDNKLPCPLDKVNRQFRVPAPNMLWVSDFTYVATWKGFAYVAFVIDAYARKFRRLARQHLTSCRVRARCLEQAVHERRPVKGMGLVHHSDRGSRSQAHLSIKYTERLAEAGIEPSVGSVGNSYDNALAETINGLFKAEVIHRRGPWRSFEAVEYATLEWVDWFKQSPPARADREHSARRGRSKLLCRSGN